MAREIFYTYSASAEPPDPTDASTKYIAPLAYSNGYYKAIAKEGNTLSAITNVNFGTAPTDYFYYFPFYSGSLTDSSINGNVLTNNGAIQSVGVKGDANGAYFFDGSNDYMLTPISTTAYMTNDFTLNMWVKQDGSNSIKGLFQWADSLTSGSPALLLQITNSEMSIYANGTYIRTNIDIPENEWFMLTIVRVVSGGHFIVYINGILTADIYPWTLSNTGNNIYFGNGYSGYCKCELDNLRLHDRALSDIEITQVYNYEKP